MSNDLCGPQVYRDLEKTRGRVWLIYYMACGVYGLTLGLVVHDLLAWIVFWLFQILFTFCGLAIASTGCELRPLNERGLITGDL